MTYPNGNIQPLADDFRDLSECDPFFRNAMVIDPGRRFFQGKPEQMRGIQPLLGLFCARVQADRSAYRFGGVTLAIVLLVPRTEPAWRIAFHRFAEVSVGIAVALVMTLVWPERNAAPKQQQSKEIH
jgi:hypothetical protein